MPPKKKQIIEIEIEEEKTTQNSVKLKEKKKTNNSNFDWIWNKQNTLIYGDSGAKPSTKILAMDLDGTLVKTKSGAKFPTNSKDWVFWDDEVVPKLNQWHYKGYKIVIFSNQNGISKGHTTENEIKKKIEKISQQIGIPLQTLIASADDEYRKPSKVLWDFFADNMNGINKIDLNASIYCGDAAGRVGKQKDFNDTDLKFAMNIGIKFKTPEDFFLGKKQKIHVPHFNPKNLPKTGPIFKEDTINTVKNIKGNKQMIVFVGSPASGKSTFWKTHLSDYIRINRDTLKSRERCLKEAEKAMEKGDCLVIDNTNPTKRDRQYFIELAKDFGYDVRAFFFNIEKNLAFHLDSLREINKYRQHFSGKVGAIPIHFFFKNLEKPQVSEGFSQVKTINFVAGPFENKQDEESFFCFASGKK